MVGESTLKPFGWRTKSGTRFVSRVPLIVWLSRSRVAPRGATGVGIGPGTAWAVVTFSCMLTEPAGAPMTRAQAIGRYLGYYVSILGLGFGFFSVGWDKRKQGWHDKIVRTVVIDGFITVASFL